MTKPSLQRDLRCLRLESHTKPKWERQGSKSELIKPPAEQSTAPASAGAFCCLQAALSRSPIQQSCQLSLKLESANGIAVTESR